MRDGPTWLPTFLTAAITAAAAIGGAAVGGWATFEGNRSLQREQTAAAARGIARVYQSEFQSVYLRFNEIADTGRLIEPTMDPFRLPEEDKTTLAASMNASDWASVRDAESGLRLADEEFAPEQRRALRANKIPKPLSEEQRAFIRDKGDVAGHAASLMTVIAGSMPPPKKVP